MRTLLCLTIAVTFILSGCARDNTAQIALFTAYNNALANCNDKPGCIAATQAAMYSGMFNRQDDTIVSVVVAMLPWGRLVLDGIAMYRGTTGSGGTGVLVRGDNNVFNGFNKVVADRGASLYSPFDATASASTSQAWTDLYNVGKNQN